MADDVITGNASADGKTPSAARETPEERRLRLLREANELPASPGVYVMHDSKDRIIYVGKSRKLCNRVSSYFRNTEKNLKTARMAASVYRFECFFCDTEIEALTLENVLIKQHTPRYNIRLKDCKSYPYIKISSGEWPVLSMSRGRKDDGARYFGPYSGTATVFSLIGQVNRIFRLPTCRRKFPRDIGKDRPCIYYQMGRCCGICTGKVTPEEYAGTISSAAELLRGHTAPVRRELEARMLRLAEEEQYEAAARCRDAIRNLDSLLQKQKAVASSDTNQDAVGVYSDESGFALSILCIRGGSITDKLDYVPDSQVADVSEAFLSLLAEHYGSSASSPGRILLPASFSSDDAALIEEVASSHFGCRVSVTVPERGDNRKLCEMAAENAKQALLKTNRNAEKSLTTMSKLASLLGLEAIPERIEAFDISNIGSENITGGMVVAGPSGFRKRDYRSFSVKSVEGTDDYASMSEVLERRLSHLTGDGSGPDSLGEMPDLILIDGGVQHLEVALRAMEKTGVYVPVAGMVKDDSHRTRALVTPEGEVDIAKEQDVFVYIYKLQEEVHRWSVSRMTTQKRRTVKHSSLEKIKGIGPGKAKLLLGHFGTLTALKSAGPDELMQVKGISTADARAILAYFARQEK